MPTFKTYSLLIFLLLCLNCKQKADINLHEHFTVERLSLQCNANIISAGYFNGKIFCLTEDDKLMILDTSLTVDQSLMVKYAGIKVAFLQPLNDSIFLGTDKGIYLLDSGFSLKKSKWKPCNYGFPYFNDSAFYVYSCCMGEWGGSVFFLSKKTNKVYSYPSTCVQQVLKFNGNYIISNSSEGFSSFLSISDPSKLFELKDETQKTFCNWYTTVDSLKNRKWASISSQRCVISYADTFGLKTLTTFPYNNELYSIYSTDSATILARHTGFKLITVDTLLKNGIHFREASTHLSNHVFVTAYRASWSVVDSNDKTINHKNSGLIFMQGNTIKFLEFNSK